MKNLVRWMMVLAMLVATLGVTGCDDGDDGAPGASAYQVWLDQGNTGTEQDFLDSLAGASAATAAEPESCAVCHSSVEDIHAAMDVASATVADGVAVAGGLEFDVDVQLDGVASDDFTLRRGYVNYADAALVDPALITNFVRTSFQLTGTVTFESDDEDVNGDPVWTQEVAVTGVELTSNGNGNYTVFVPTTAEIPDMDESLAAPGPITYTTATYVVADGTYLFQLQSDMSDERPVVVAVAAGDTSQLRDLVTDTGCANCHGDFPAWSEKFRHYAVGGSKCQICHSQATRSTAFISKDAAGEFVTSTPAIFGTNITEYIHGIHNSHNMPDGVYYRTNEPDATATIEDQYAVGYPSDIRNCSVCHTETAQLDAAASAPVSYYLCMTCHNNWDGFVHTHDDTAEPPAYKAGDMIITGFLDFHRDYGPDQTCLTSGCHNTASRDEAADFHDDFQADDRHYDSFYRGEDISFANKDQVTFAITGVTSDGSDVSFTWTASKNGAAVNPCNKNVATGPVYTDLGAYLAYAKGDDWVNEFVGTAPGQPQSAKNLFSSLATTCAAATPFTATTTGLVLDEEALAYADKVLLAIGGKPLDQDTFTIGSTDTTKSYFVREPSPTYAFNPDDGSPATMRRAAVANAKCLGCHQGTLYQHGGDRVDNEQLCVVCHNPSAGDKNNRAGFYEIVNADGTVNTDATYDGKNNETYDMRTMIHAIHGVEKRVTPWTVYRSRGIYAFATPLYEEVGNDVFAVDYPKPAGWPADGVTVDGCLSEEIRSDGTPNCEIAHNWTVVHYPRPANACEACHNDGLYEAPDQTKAVPLTVDPGMDYPDQSDDTVIGPTAAACTACHYDTATNRHATVDFGYKANVTKEEMLEKAAQ